MQNNGLITQVWGAPGWLYLHSVSFGYPINPDEYDEKNDFEPGTTRANYKRFFSSVGDTLPCKYCRNSYKEYISEDPIQLDSREDLTMWLWRIHNRVNLKLGKEYDLDEITYEKVVEKYEEFRANCSKKSKGCTDQINNKPKECKIIIKNVNMCEKRKFIIIFSSILLIISIILYRSIV